MWRNCETKQYIFDANISLILYNISLSISLTHTIPLSHSFTLSLPLTPTLLLSHSPTLLLSLSLPLSLHLSIEAILHLSNLVPSSSLFQVVRKVVTTSVEIPTSALESRAKELNIYDLRPFYKSSLFRSHGLQVDEQRRVIIKKF